MDTDKIIYQYEPLWGSWKIKEMIGRGSIGNVYKISKKVLDREQISAVKFISIPTKDQYENFSNIYGITNQSSSEKFFNDLINKMVQEINLLYELKGNSNIISYEDCMVYKINNKNLWHILIRMEYAKTLSDYVIEKKNDLSENEVIQIGIDLCSALITCHNKEIIHRDIKEANVFISDRGEFKLGDFSVSRELNEYSQAHTRVGTINYMPPEVLKGKPYGKQADIYSLGLMLYKLSNYGRLPFLPPHNKDFEVTDLENSQNKRLLGKKFNPPENISKEFFNILLKACAYKQSNRFISAKDFKENLLVLLRNPTLKSDNSLYPNNSETIHVDNLHTINKKQKQSLFQLLAKKLLILSSSIALFFIITTLVLFMILKNQNSDEKKYSILNESITQKSIHELRLDSSSQTISQFSENGKNVITTGYPYEEILIWNSSNEKLEKTISIDENVNSYALSNDGKYLVAFYYGEEKIVIRDLKSQKEHKTYNNIELSSSADFIVSNNLKYIIYPSSNQIILIKLDNPKKEIKLSGHTASVNKAVFSNNSKEIFSIADDGKIKIWDTSNGKCTKTIAASKDEIHTIAISSDSKKAIITTSGETKNILLWNLDSGKILKSIIGIDLAPTKISISENGSKIAFLDNGSIYIYSTYTGACLSKLSLDDSKSISSSSDLYLNEEESKVLTENYIFDIEIND
ncbi:MAG: protein kinase [Clostridiales bacterium]